MAWDATKPADDGLLINAPGQIRANWDAIALGTDAALLTTNAKCASDLALPDSKLAQITTAAKVSGAALTLLPNIPAGAGNIPAANLGNAPNPFKTGDWILSTVTTAREGWTNVSATYSNKFMRINATPLTTGGADTHSHTLAETNLPSHSHSVGSFSTASSGAHTHQRYYNAGTLAFSGYYYDTNTPSLPQARTDSASMQADIAQASAHTHTISGTSGAIGSGTSFTGANVPAYVQVVVFQKD